MVRISVICLGRGGGAEKASRPGITKMLLPYYYLWGLSRSWCIYNIFGSFDCHLYAFRGSIERHNFVSGTESPVVLSNNRIFIQCQWLLLLRLVLIKALHHLNPDLTFWRFHRFRQVSHSSRKLLLSLPTRLPTLMNYGMSSVKSWHEVATLTWKAGKWMVISILVVFQII